MEVFGIPRRDHVGRKEVRLLDVRSKFGGDHSQRGRFRGGGNGALESTREGREEEAHHEDRERAECAESEASSGVSQRPSGTISRIIAGAS